MMMCKLLDKQRYFSWRVNGIITLLQTFETTLYVFSSSINEIHFTNIAMFLICVELSQTKITHYHRQFV